MILVYINKNKYFYDIHSLVKSFYPGEEVKLELKEEPEQGEERVIAPGLKSESVDKNLEENGEAVRLVIYIELSWEEGYISLKACPEEGKELSLREKCLKDENVDSSIVADSPKNVCKQLLYRALCAITGSGLPWGTLTGIRPVKIVLNKLDRGESRDEAYSYMTDTFLCSREKADLSMEIAGRERRILQGTVDGRGYSLYINIPFCPTRCAYCSFMSSPAAVWEKKIDDYLSCLEYEMRQMSSVFKDMRCDSVYIGGGTPTTLSPGRLERLYDAIYSFFDLGQIREFTTEAGRPDSIDMDKLGVMKKWGVTRISVNPQTMKDETLKLIGRAHDSRQTIESYYAAREAGFDHINMDLILGLPRETEKDVENTLRKILELSPDELTVHSLAIKRSSYLYQYVEENGLGGLDTSGEMMNLASSYAARMDLHPYYLYRQKNIGGNFENTGYGREGKMCFYNVVTMEETESILALGSGSVSKRVYSGAEKGRIERFGNPKDVKLYMENYKETSNKMKEFFIN